MSDRGAVPDPGTSIVGAGAMTAVGWTWRASAAAVRAGLSGIRAHPFVVDRKAEPIRVAPALDLETGPEGVERIEALAGAALAEAVAEASRSGVRVEGAALVLALPHPRPGLGSLQSLADRLSAGACRLVPHRTLEGGHAAGLAALAEGNRTIARRDFEVCVVGAVDTHLCPDTLEWLDGRDKLHGPGRPWGLVPGEAAAFVVLASPRWAPRAASGPIGTVRAVAASLETRLDPSGPPCLGEGLSQAIADACAPALAAGRRVSDVYCDLNGERWRAAEYGFAVLKLGDVLENPSDFWSPADCWGDVGAASGTLLTVAALAAGRRGWARGDEAVVWCASESAERGAALFSCGPPEVGRALCR